MISFDDYLSQRTVNEGCAAGYDEETEYSEHSDHNDSYVDGGGYWHSPLPAMDDPVL